MTYRESRCRGRAEDDALTVRLGSMKPVGQRLLKLITLTDWLKEAVVRAGW